jgi:hypothetical protein
MRRGPRSPLVGEQVPLVCRVTTCRDTRRRITEDPNFHSRPRLRQSDCFLSPLSCARQTGTSPASAGTQNPHGGRDGLLPSGFFPVRSRMQSRREAMQFCIPSLLQRQNALPFASSIGGRQMRAQWPIVRQKCICVFCWTQSKVRLRAFVYREKCLCM